MFRGMLSIESNHDVVASKIHSPDTTIIILDEEDTRGLTRFDNVTMGSILLPPYEALSCLLEGAYDNFMEIYTNYLASPNVDNFITAIFCCLYRDKNVILYDITGDELSTHVVLLDFFQRMYGISVGCQLYIYNLLPSSIPLLLDKIYLYNNIGVDEYLLSWPSHTNTISNVVMQKIVYDLQINPNMVNPYQYVYEYREQLKYTTQLPPTKMVPLFIKKEEPKEENKNETDIPF